jgi:hypothetical protein
VILHGGGATNYVWSGGVSDGTAFVPAATATYRVTGTDAHGCNNTDSIHIVVNALPTITVHATPSDTICRGGSVTLNGVGAVSYNWSGGVNNGVAFSPTATNIYTVIGTDAHSCTNSTTVTVVVKTCTSISPQTPEGGLIQAYPNPNSGSFTLETNEQIGQTYIITDMLGQIVQEKAITSDKQRIELNTATGVYTLMLKGMSGAVRVVVR